MFERFLEDRSDQVAELASDDDACSENRETPDDGEVASAVFGSENLVVDESNEEVLLRLGRRSSTRGREEASLRRTVTSERVRVSRTVRNLSMIDELRRGCWTSSSKGVKRLSSSECAVSGTPSAPAPLSSRLHLVDTSLAKPVSSLQSYLLHPLLPSCQR